MARSEPIAPKTNPERSEETTRRLFNAAIQLFSEKGYEATSASEIAAYAGFNRNMIRDRFGSKEALLEALLEQEYAERLLPAMRRDRIGDGLTLLLGQVEDLINAVRRDPELMRALLAISFEAPRTVADIRLWYAQLIDAYQSELAAHITTGQHDGSIRARIDPAHEAETIGTYTVGLSMRWIVLGPDYDIVANLTRWRDELADRLAER